MKRLFALIAAISVLRVSTIAFFPIFLANAFGAELRIAVELFLEAAPVVLPLPVPTDSKLNR